MNELGKLDEYYKTLFPFAQLFRWLSYGDDGDLFSRRDVAYQIATAASDHFVRYKSWHDFESFATEIRRVNPKRIDIGAIYSCAPAQRCALGSQFLPQLKELVFDIDISDYNDVRFCCTETNICARCWPLIAIAVQLIDRRLREEFVFNDILWVYSGRRGVHCWVSDRAALLLGNGARASVLSFLSLPLTDENGQFVVRLPEIQNPSVFVRYQQLCAPFLRYAEIQELFLRPERWNALLARVVKSEKTRNELCALLSDGTVVSTNERWLQMCAIIEQNELTERILQEIVFTVVHPRFDVRVTIDTKHLLKCPFVVHPETKRVCIPFAVDTVDQFNPLAVPTTAQLLDDGIVGAAARAALAAAVTLFERFVDVSLNERN